MPSSSAAAAPSAGEAASASTRLMRRPAPLVTVTAGGTGPCPSACASSAALDPTAARPGSVFMATTRAAPASRAAASFTAKLQSPRSTSTAAPRASAALASAAAHAEGGSAITSRSLAPGAAAANWPSRYSPSTTPAPSCAGVHPPEAAEAPAAATVAPAATSTAATSTASERAPAPAATAAEAASAAAAEAPSGPRGRITVKWPAGFDRAISFVAASCALLAASSAASSSAAWRKASRVALSGAPQNRSSTSSLTPRPVVWDCSARGGAGGPPVGGLFPRAKSASVSLPNPSLSKVAMRRTA
mmetsp:Transcript_13460/g.51346  ORF Transcript_13460/g.51346 Transcript_13460/m.51346 type:complete len:303 (+) Transcript_13460:49-957(+)